MVATRRSAARWAGLRVRSPGTDTRDRRTTRPASEAEPSTTDNPGKPYSCRAHRGSIAAASSIIEAHAVRAGVASATHLGIGGTKLQRVVRRASAVTRSAGRTCS